MTDAELQAIRERCEKATPGPWSGEYGSVVNWKGNSFTMEWIDNRRASKAQRDADCTFIASARSDVPALLAEVARLRRVEAAARAAVAADADDSALSAARVLNALAELRRELEG